MSVYKSCFFTGHRNIPYKLYDKVREDVREKMCILIKKGITEFIAGGAWGFDMLCSEEVIKMKEKYPHIKLHLFLPCHDHNSKWSFENKEKFEVIRKNADTEILINDEAYFDGCMHKRNCSMADSALYCIAYCNRKGSGTGQTIDYAKSLGRIIVNIA